MFIQLNFQWNTNIILCTADSPQQIWQNQILSSTKLSSFIKNPVCLSSGTYRSSDGTCSQHNNTLSHVHSTIIHYQCILLFFRLFHTHLKVYDNDLFNMVMRIKSDPKTVPYKWRDPSNTSTQNPFLADGILTTYYNTKCKYCTQVGVFVENAYVLNNNGIFCKALNTILIESFSTQNKVENERFLISTRQNTNNWHTLRKMDTQI